MEPADADGEPAVAATAEMERELSRASSKLRDVLASLHKLSYTVQSVDALGCDHATDKLASVYLLLDRVSVRSHHTLPGRISTAMGVAVPDRSNHCGRLGRAAAISTISRTSLPLTTFPPFVFLDPPPSPPSWRQLE